MKKNRQVQLAEVDKLDISYLVESDRQDYNQFFDHYVINCGVVHVLIGIPL